MGLMERFNYVMSGEDGASNLEIIVWMAVVLVIAGFLFAFRSQITKFIGNATGQVNKMDTGMSNTLDAGLNTGNNQSPTIQ